MQFKTADNIFNFKIIRIDNNPIYFQFDSVRFQ